MKRPLERFTSRVSEVTTLTETTEAIYKQVK